MIMYTFGFKLYHDLGIMLIGRFNTLFCCDDRKRFLMRLIVIFFYFDPITIRYLFFVLLGRIEMSTITQNSPVHLK